MQFTWPHVRVHHLCTHTVREAYGLVDNGGWADILRRRAERNGVRFIEGMAQGVTHGSDGSRVDIGGQTIVARSVVDASGGAGALLERRGEPSLFQVAYGETIEANLGPAMRWMEFGDEGTFLYAMPLGRDRVFVEETALVTTGMTYEDLRDRLHRRLAKLGIRTGRTLSIERVRIPMDVPIPPVQRVVAFGAASGMVHPATGYLLPRVVADAPILASTLAAHLNDGPEVASRAAWNALWPVGRLRQRELHRWGSEVVSRLDPSQLRTFFASFFALPPDVRRRWLADTLPPAHLAGAMATVFSRLPLGLKWRVATSSRAVFASLFPRLLEVS